MKRFFTVVVCFIGILQSAQAQNKNAEINTSNGVFYMGFGTNLSYYSRSNISFITSTSDFVLEKVRGKDDRGLNFDGGGAAQYSYQAGYYFKKKNFGIEFNFDHIKYFARQNQVVHVKGTIEGKTVNTDTAMAAIVQNFEHSDGGNYALFNFVKWKNLRTSQNRKNSLDLVWKAGAGPVIPKTNSTVMGRHYDDRYKLSGFVVALEGGLRYHFLHNFYVAPSLKGAYANYSSFAIADGQGKQHWFALHFNILVGGQVNL
jgi:hypothetical protein